MAKQKAKSRQPARPAETSQTEKPTTLRDLLSADTLSKLKDQADSMRAEEAKRKEEQRAQAEAVRKAEQKRLDNDFEHLLNNSSTDWRKFK